MLILPPPLAMGLGAGAPMGSTRVLAPGQLRMVGALFAPGQRTVTSVWRVLGKRDDRHCQTSPRVRRRAPWPARCGGRLRRRWLGRAVVPPGPVVLGIDETSDRRRGETIAAHGMAREPVRASQAPLGNARGWRGVRLRRLTRLPGTTRGWGWPWLTGLSPSARDAQHRRRSPRPLGHRARPAVWLGRRWRPERERGVVGAPPAAAPEWREAVRHAVGGGPCWRRDAAR